MMCQSCQEPHDQAQLLGGESVAGHSYCFDCFPVYIDGLAAPDFVRGIPRCPDGGCSAQCISSTEFAAFLAQAGRRTIKRYLEVVQTLTTPPEEEPFMLKLQSCLEIMCPGCNAVQDPMPDGCRAMHCGGCSTFYCWICMAIFETSKACHGHVSEIHNNNRGFFTSQDIVNVGQLKLRKTRLRALMKKYSEPGRQQLVNEEVRQLLHSTDPSLVGVALNPYNLASDVVLDGPGDIKVGLAHGAATGTAKIAAEKMGFIMAEKAAVVGGQSLANVGAIMTDAALTVLTESSTTTLAAEKIFSLMGERAIKKTLVDNAANRILIKGAETVANSAVTSAILSTASSSAIGAAAVKVLFIGYDGVRWATGRLPAQHAAAQFRSRLANLAMNASGSAIGAGVGTLICPGWGTFLGNMVGSMVTGTQNLKVL